MYFDNNDVTIISAKQRLVVNSTNMHKTFKIQNYAQEI